MCLFSQSISLVLATLLLAGCGGPAAAPPAEEAAAQAAPRIAEAAVAREEPAKGYVGVVVAAETVDLASELRGRLVQVSVRPGERVGKGMAVATIEPLDLTEQLVSAEAAVQMARSGVSQAQTALRLAQERVTRVSAAPEVFSEEERSVAAGNRETSEKDLETARARLVQAESELRRLKGQSARRVLRATTEGWVAARLLDPGALVEAGQPVVRLKRGDRYLLRFAVPPGETARWPAGRPVRWRPESLDRAFEAKVARVAQQVDAPSQMVFVEADLDPSSAAGLLRDGLIVRVEPADVR